MMHKFGKPTHDWYSMARTKQTARRSTGGCPPRERLAAMAAAMVNKMDKPGSICLVLFVFCFFFFFVKFSHLLLYFYTSKRETEAQVETRNSGASRDQEIPKIH